MRYRSLHYAANLDAILRQQGRKREWLALRLGVTRYTVSRWLHGRVPFPIARVPELAEVLGYARWEELADELGVNREDIELVLRRREPGDKDGRSSGSSRG